MENLKIAILTYKILNEKSNVFCTFSEFSQSHTYNTKCSKFFSIFFLKNMAIRPVDYNAKQSNSSYVFKKYYKQTLLMSSIDEQITSRVV